MLPDRPVDRPAPCQDFTRLADAEVRVLVAEMLLASADPVEDVARLLAYVAGPSLLIVARVRECVPMLRLRTMRPE
jgi:hypothetical protein